MDRYPPYHPPVLSEQITIRNPADKPTGTVNSYGVEMVPEWGVQVLANRRDSSVNTSYEEGLTVYVGATIWTIRDRPGVAANAEVVTQNGDVYEMIGPPLERGGPNGGRLARYLELHTRRRVT